ncbi:hypothetical protein CFP56_013106 [Quercus suber]|uniref:Uncharacterized protein n=1 Tax=Quercus suber TaxID=58331 RepID=A0AAW0M442_QUESU
MRLDFIGIKAIQDSFLAFSSGLRAINPLSTSFPVFFLPFIYFWFLRSYPVACWSALEAVVKICSESSIIDDSKTCQGLLVAIIQSGISWG